MTDAEIIKALKCCIKDKCSECPLKSMFCSECVVMGFALELINRQKATIEKCADTLCKKEDMAQLIAEERKQYYDELQTAKAEIESLKERLSHTVGIDNTKQNGYFPFD